jgi:peptide-methionine (S)-S-oxide reductase
MLFGSALKRQLPTREEALPGRPTRPYDVPPTHVVLGTSMFGPWPEGTQVAYFALGCFWGEEKKFWETPGVVTTAVGYQGGLTPNPTYEETCTGKTGHAETVLVAYDPSKVTIEELLKVFWEAHDPTQGMRQGNDVGTQYRSAFYYTTPEQKEAFEASRASYQDVLKRHRFGDITTELRSAEDAGEFYYAEDYHQQYLHKVPWGYCGVGGTGVSCPVGVAKTTD